LFIKVLESLYKRFSYFLEISNMPLDNISRIIKKNCYALTRKSQMILKRIQIKSTADFKHSKLYSKLQLHFLIQLQFMITPYTCELIYC